MTNNYEELEETYMGIPREKINDLNAKYLDGLTEKQKIETLKRWRLVKDFEDGNAVGTILIDNISVKQFNELRRISKTFFSNSDGVTVSALVELFNAEKRKQEMLKVKE